MWVPLDVAILESYELLDEKKPYRCPAVWNVFCSIAKSLKADPPALPRSKICRREVLSVKDATENMLTLLVNRVALPNIAELPFRLSTPNPFWPLEIHSGMVLAVAWVALLV